MTTKFDELVPVCEIGRQPGDGRTAQTEPLPAWCGSIVSSQYQWSDQALACWLAHLAIDQPTSQSVSQSVTSGTSVVRSTLAMSHIAAAAAAVIITSLHATSTARL